MSEGLTYEQAVALSKSNFWEGMIHRDIAVFQMNEKRLCMPFGVFHEAVEKTLGRPVWTHEFTMNCDGILAELNGGPAPTFSEIMNMIPADKRIVMTATEAPNAD